MLQVHKSSLPKTVSLSLAEAARVYSLGFFLSRKSVSGKEHKSHACACLGQRDGEGKVKLGYVG